jgi:predicted acetyltransferase
MVNVKTRVESSGSGISASSKKPTPAFRPAPMRCVFIVRRETERGQGRLALRATVCRTCQCLQPVRLHAGEAPRRLWQIFAQRYAPIAALAVH